MKKAFLIVILSSLIISVFPIQKTKAWINNDFTPYGSYFNVHNDDTAIWCSEKGMSAFWAKKAGNSCAAVDIIFVKNRSWHLDRHKFTGDSKDTRLLQSENQMIIAKKLLDLAAHYNNTFSKATSRLERLRLSSLIKRVKSEAVLYLGRSLHPMQDIYAHLDAGIDAPEDEVRFSHGMLDAKAVDVKVFCENGKCEIKQEHLEVRDSRGKLYSIYDDLNYDFIDSSWVFKQNMNKEDNTRWQRTKTASYALIDEFTNYAAALGLSFSE